MRLLHLENGQPIITDFTGKPIPPYAILSHRWGDEEVLLEDLTYDSYGSKPEGHAKIELCARLAAEEGLRYFWIDTCCIDRWDRRERSTAINSMYDWYKSAKKCYAFLSDVRAQSVAGAQQQSTWEVSFRKSVWFTRGWTLQELVAPECVEFYSEEGYWLGNKGTLAQLLQEITGIPTRALHGYSPNDFTTDEIRKWTIGRETTEPEDAAYCLLGMLNVSMLTSYGEGKKSAWSRLLEELKHHDIALSNIPYSRNQQFVGRETQLAQVEADLFSGTSTTIIVIAGPGGTGKSQLALEAAYRTKEQHPTCSTYWIDASDSESLRQSYTSVALKLGILVRIDEQVDSRLLVNRRLSEKEAGQWLLVLDNADDLENWLPREEIQSINSVKYMPSSSLGSIILTSTNSEKIKTAAVQNVIELQTLELDAARKMMDSLLTSSTASVQEQQTMDRVLEQISRLPLSIVQAAAYINVTGTLLSDYLSVLTKDKNEFTSEDSALCKEARAIGRGRDH